MDKLCILNLKNLQEEYAIALDFIKAIEDKKSGTVDERRKVILEMAKKISVSIGNVQKDISARYLEQPISVTGRGKDCVVSISNKHDFTENDIEVIEKGYIRYQIRINFENSKNLDTIEESQLIRLQYLAMFLKKVSQFFICDKQSKGMKSTQKDNQKPYSNLAEQELKKHLTVFIVPVTGEVYPFKNRTGQVDYNTYIHVSRYLRFLSKTYTGVIYGLDESSDQPVVTSLDFRKNKKCKTHFPLIIIDEEIYEWLFNNSIKDILEELFSLKKNGRFRNSREENPKKALKDFVAETDLYHIRSVASTQYCLEILHFLKSCRSISLMEFSLFAFMLSEKKEQENSGNEYISVWHLAHEISQGLKQVMQNAIQHTESKECYFSFYLHERGSMEDRNSFVSRITQLYPNTYFDVSAGKAALEIFISDLNDKEDMVDNFISNLTYEYNEQIKCGVKDGLSGHLKLIGCREKLAIRNFFSVYNNEDAREEWKNFRQQDLIAHIGLSQFAQTIDRCKASVNVISSKYSRVTDEKRFFYQAYASNHENNMLNSKKKGYISIIPGTQFSILIPIQLWKDSYSMGIGQLEQQNHVAENYVSFASFLDYSEKRIVMPKEKEIHSDQLDILDARRKYRLVQNWRHYWENKISENIKATYDGKYIFNYDFDKVSSSFYFSNEDRIEVCLKGIMNALDFANNLDEYLLIAFTNLPERFIEIFRRLSVQLSVRRFPIKLQLCLHEKQCNEKKNKRVVMLGSDFSQAIYNAYVLSMEQGFDGFDKADCEKAFDIKEVLMSELDTQEKHNQQDVIGVCPFDVILNCSETDKRSFFEKQLKETAEGSLDEELVGYKLNNTHMRLGSKVHIESFYEMSFLFYRTTIANRLAFIILKQMKEGASGKNDTEKKIDLVRDNILFYGYASYSKAILTSINEILREYRKMHSSNISCQMEDQIAIASFQHNLMLESEETQMYYDLPSENFPGNVEPSGYLKLWEKIKVIQIVPISSTLTTFDKMWRKFFSSIIEDGRDNIYLAGNYTVFWVVDKNGNLEDGMPSKIEEKYWKNVLPNHQIKTKLSILNEKNKEISADDKTDKENMDIQYIIRSSVVWHDPLACELCYPEYVINEMPLVETDATSTVPTQQIRYREYQYNRDTIATVAEYDRFTKLRGCVFYDHICRRQNHYQFYIDTQRYFYNVKNMVKDWLVEQSKEFLHETNEPVLHIIFSPEHNTNVGFVQYVNTYYFNGLAEIVSINVDKQFRSNFICEHAAIKTMIEELHRDRHDMKNLPVKFYFVDDTVITGDTLGKANGLLHSLVPSNEYPVNLFSKIFVLVDRLSDETKQSYVDRPDKNFMAFLHIDVSNVRTHGDSCIGCKLEQDAEKLYKRSATRNMATYWFGKLEDYRKKPYDNKSEMRSIQSSKSYRMLLFSHVLQNVVVKRGNCYTLGDVYDIILNLSLWLLKVDDYEDKTAYGYKKYLEDMRNMDGVCTLLKTICRPFFSYDFKIKRQAYTFFVFLTELILGEKSNNIVPKEFETKESIGYLFENDRIFKMEILAKNIAKNFINKCENEINFLKDYLLEGLTDMGSTYAMRMQTIKKVYSYFREKGKDLSEDKKTAFWNSYEVNIHRLVTGNADESRELWLEYMYITGMEYRDFCRKDFENNTLYEPKFLYETITEEELTNPQEKYFYQFCHNLFLQNIRINFDELEEKCDVQQSTESIDGDFLRDYWKQMRALDSFENPLLNSEGKKLDTKSEEKLFGLLKSGTNEVIEPSVNEWYEKFLKYIVDVIVEKYNVDKKSINIAMLTENNENVEHINRIQFFDIVQDIVNSGKTGISETRYYIKERVVDALESGGMFDLENNGYTISEGSVLNGEKRPYVIAFFDNPRKGKQERSLARVFLYISIADDIETNKKELTLRLILRDVLMYRNRILRFLERDFAGEIYANYAHTIGERNILSHEKAHSHNTTADDAISLEIFQGEKIFGKESDYAILKKTTAAEWLLLRNYTNGQIAKIFNRSFHDRTEDVYSLNSPMLYIPNDSINYSNSLFKQKLDVFSRLNLKNENWGASDDRFKLLNQIIDIQYDETLNDAVFIQGNNRQFYNLEYFKCILIDIMFSAIKFESDRPDYLLRIDRFLEIKEKLEKDVPSWDINDEELAGLIERLRDSQCSIRIFRGLSFNSDIDYLVIQNPVKEMDNSLGKWEEQNEIIKHRLNNPLDYADGHMSLLAIKRYIENLDETMELECGFQYLVRKEDNGHEKLYFENRLPILKRR